MKMIGIKSIVAAGALALFSSQAGAGTYTEYCPGLYSSVTDTSGNNVDVIRYLELGWSETNVTMTCLDWGSQLDSEQGGSGNPDYEGDAEKVFELGNPSWTKIGKEQPDTHTLTDWVSYSVGTLFGATSGTFQFEDQGGYDTYVLLWKFGEPHQIASWMAVQVNFLADMVGKPFEVYWNAYWVCGSESQPECPSGELALSHLTLYGKDVPQVPLPAGGVLLLTALGGMALIRRRKLVAA